MESEIEKLKAEIKRLESKVETLQAELASTHHGGSVTQTNVSAIPTYPENPPFKNDPIHPDVLEYARQTLDVEEFLREMEKLKEEGGHTFESFFPEVKRRAGVE